MTRRVTIAALIAAGLAVAALLAALVGPFASPSPDGLEKVSQEQGFDDAARDHALADSPVADYLLRGVGNEAVATGLAGLLGVGLTFAVGYGVFALARRRARRAEKAGDAPPRVGTRAGNGADGRSDDRT